MPSSPTTSIACATCSAMARMSMPVTAKAYPRWSTRRALDSSTVATYLVEHKADRQSRDRSGWTAAHVCRLEDDRANSCRCCSAWREARRRPSDGLTPLAIAAQNAKVKAARGAWWRRGRRQRAGCEGRLHAADAGGHFGLDRPRRLADGARCEGKRRQSRRRHRADDRGRRQSCRTVAEMLLKSGADVNARSEDGRTALSIAAGQQRRRHRQDPARRRAEASASATG